MISEEQYNAAAKKIGCEPAAIKAVDAVESSGSGMLNGRPVILFEPHIFWRELEACHINPTTHLPVYAHLLYKHWGEKPYPKGQDAQYDRLRQASLIHR